jgi:lysophospholipase L1-like esterase
VLQPTLHDKGSKPLTPQELAADNAHQSWIEAVGPGYPMLRAAGASLRAAQVNFFDASMIFKDTPQTLYFDACHFRAPGVVMLAEQIAPRFLEVLRER